MENQLINVVELTNYLVQTDIELFYDYGTMYSGGDSSKYSEEGQEIFDELYNKYYSIILNCKA